MHILRPKIIGVVLLLGLLFSQAPMAHALYSPVLSKEASEIKQDIMGARQQNGQGSWLNAWDKVNQDNAEYKRRGMATGTPGMFSLMGSAAGGMIVQSVTESFPDGITWLFPWLRDKTSCLRDDIWELQALQEEVLNEMFKASLLDDLVHGGALLEDYKYLQARIDGETKDDKGIRIHGLKVDYADTSYWFPGGTETNYYMDCPYGAFTMAIKQAGDSLSRMVDAFSGEGFQLGSLQQMWSIAEQRAVKRAAEYIAKNQIKISFGGAPGANPQGLINGNGLEGLAADVKTGIGTAVAYYDSTHAGELLSAAGNSFVGGGEALYNLFGGSTEINKALWEYSAAWEGRTKDLNRISNSLTFGIQLSHVSEQSLKAIEGKMVEINTLLKEATDQKSVPKMCEKLNLVVKNQCKNKSSAPSVNCKE
jgi:hypothetical protein